MNDENAFSHIKTPITPDGRTGFNERGNLMAWTAPDESGAQSGYYIADVRPYKCYICDRGWGNTTEELLNQTQDASHPGQYMHKTCLYGHQKLVSRNQITDSLIAAGFLFDMTEIPARYPGSTPWQRVSVLLGDPDRTDSSFRIVMGRRRHVWELRLHGAGDLSDKFEDVKETKGYQEQSKEDPELGPYYLVHAWETDQMIDYLSRFWSAIPGLTPR